jgi:hypothetical protein
LRRLFAGFGIGLAAALLALGLGFLPFVRTVELKSYDWRMRATADPSKARTDIVLVDLDGDLARTEPDPEIQDLIRASAGLNLALDYLPGSTMFDPLADRPDATLASSVVWFDALVSNVDRTVRNPNLLMWHRRLWLIDHGAAFYFHHGDGDFAARTQDPFTRIREHVLLPWATALMDVDAALAARLGDDAIRAIVRDVPDSWLADASAANPRRSRDAYADYLVARLGGSRPFAQEAQRAQALHV